MGGLALPLLVLFPLLLLLTLPLDVGDAGCVSEVGESGSVIAIYEKNKTKNQGKKKKRKEEKKKWYR